MSEPIIVQTAEGKLRGTIRKNFDGEVFYGFLGVPYAEPPIGNLRFKAPKPVNPWSGVKDATKEGTRIFQRDVITTKTNKVSGTEDGLHLNVFTKKLGSQESKLNPVMVWIHGGGFVEGFNNTNIYGPEYLMLEDIVLVTINYRLGLLGFLELEDPSLEIFGNAGLKDQLEVLEWVKRNIRNFGGDANNVTISGESAGSISVENLLYCARARGLFHRAILQSGLLGWAIPSLTPGLIAFIGKENESEAEILKYLRNLSVEQLFELQENYYRTLPFGLVGAIMPRPEKENPTAIRTKELSELKKSGEFSMVPMLTGMCSNEVAFMNSVSDGKNIKLSEAFPIKSLLQRLLQAEQDSEIVKESLKKLENVYGNTADDHAQMASDFLVLNAIDSGKYYAKVSNEPLYFYNFALDTGLNLWKERCNLQFPGATHFDDIGYLFKTELSLKRGSQEESYVRRLVKLWTNFAKYGNPTPDENEFNITWKPLQENAENVLVIGKELLLKTESERDKIWKEIKSLATINSLNK